MEPTYYQLKMFNQKQFLVHMKFDIHIAPIFSHNYYIIENV